MIYKVQLADEAKLDLSGIFEYIAFSFATPRLWRGVAFSHIVAIRRQISYSTEKYHKLPTVDKSSYL